MTLYLISIFFLFVVVLNVGFLHCLSEFWEDRSKGGSQLNCLFWLIIHNCSMILTTLLSLQLIYIPSASPLLSPLQVKRCYHLSTTTFIRSSPLCLIRSVFWKSFSSSFPFFLINGFPYHFGSSRAAEWWSLFLALWIMILPFLSFQPFVPLSMSWSCLNQPFQVLKMEVIKFISGLIVTCFQQIWGALHQWAGETKVLRGCCSSFSIDSMI